MSVIDKGDRSSGPSLVSTGARRGNKGSKYISFPYAVFENAFLRWTSELKTKDILRSSADLSAVEEQLEEAKGTLADLNHKIGKAKARMLADGDFDALVDVLRTLEDRKKETEATIERLTTELQSERGTSLADAKHLAHALVDPDLGEQKEELRTRLKARIAALVKKISISVTVRKVEHPKMRKAFRGDMRIAEVKVQFDGGKERSFTITAVLSRHPIFKDLAIGAGVLGDPREDFGPPKAGGIPAWFHSDGSWFYTSKEIEKAQPVRSDSKKRRPSFLTRVKTQTN